MLYCLAVWVACRLIQEALQREDKGPGRGHSVELSQGTSEEMKGALKRASGRLEALFLDTQVGDTQVPWGYSAAGSRGGSSDSKVAIRTQSGEARDEPPPTRWCGTAVPGRGPKAARGRREGGSCWRRARAQAWEHQAEESRGGPDRWSFVSRLSSSGGVAKQISP